MTTVGLELYLVGETGECCHTEWFATPFNQLESSYRGEITITHDHHPPEVRAAVGRLFVK